MDWFERFTTVLDDMEKVGLEYAQAKSTSWLLQELGPAMKSSIMLDAMKTDPKISAQKAEAIARASEAYSKHLEGTAVAIATELRLKARYENLHAKYEAMRSVISLEKKSGIPQ
jgi:hypothetical protein